VNIKGLDFDQCYRAVESRDQRFDGQFIVGVRTTGIYCRPSCPTPVQPKRENVVFLKSAAAAQLAGFRACKRCRPDAIPGSPEWDTRADLAGRAMRLIADGVVDREGVSGLARRLALSERHLHRILVDAVGAPATALATAQRAQTARVLIETTGLPFAEIAFGAGFPSIRQFNDAIRRVFAASPTELRGGSRRREEREAGWLTVRMPVRLPFDGERLLSWLARRAVRGIEEADDRCYRRALDLPNGPGVVELEPMTDHVRASFRLGSVADLAAAVARCRRLLDLDADPEAVAAVLGADPVLAPSVAARPGLRVPGSTNGAETAIRVLLGQQLSLGAAKATLSRLVAAYGKPLDQAQGTVTHLFPTPETLAEASLDAAGISRARSDTLRELARRLADGTIQLDPGADRPEVAKGLISISGIGPWTVSMVALRALRDPDAFPGADLGIVKGARLLGLPSSPAGLVERAERWRPWRGYAAQHLWEVDS
jgi:AraC family transcriptional regulator of adaptative response / DNA-3-methyladenine glycosylase II